MDDASVAADDVLADRRTGEDVAVGSELDARMNVGAFGDADLRSRNLGPKMKHGLNEGGLRIVHDDERSPTRLRRITVLLGDQYGSHRPIRQLAKRGRLLGEGHVRRTCLIDRGHVLNLHVSLTAQSRRRRGRPARAW